MQNGDKALSKNWTAAPASPTINSATALTDTDCTISLFVDYSDAQKSLNK